MPGHGWSAAFNKPQAAVFGCAGCDLLFLEKVNDRLRDLLRGIGVGPFLQHVQGSGFIPLLGDGQHFTGTTMEVGMARPDYREDRRLAETLAADTLIQWPRVH